MACPLYEGEHIGVNYEQPGRVTCPGFLLLTHGLNHQPPYLCLSYHMKILRISILLLALSLLFIGASMAPGRTSDSTTEAVKWMTFEQAVEKSKTEKRKIFIDVYTDWCGWCKVMDNKTFTDARVAKILNEEFYPVKFNAEQREDVVFQGTTFKFIASGRGGYHQLAASLLNNKMSYPNFVFLTDEFHIVPLVEGYSSLPGFRKPEEFHFFLSYVADEEYKKMNIVEYQKIYRSPYASAK